MCCWSGLPAVVAGVAAGLALTGCAGVPSPPVTAVVDAVIAPDGVLLQQDGAPILFYRSRPEVGREPWRVHYLHPLHAPSGEVLTEDAPPDHLHQRGVYWAWRRILVDGVPVADGWVGRDLALQVESPLVRRHEDGSAEIRATALWIVPVGGTATPVIREYSTIRAFPLDSGVRRIDVDVRLVALRPSVALGGTDDDKGYSGLSFRLRDAPQVQLHSGGQDLRATVARMATGPTVRFAWGTGSPLSSKQVTIECRVDGRSWQEWVLRQESSMQNCAFPGRVPASVPVDGELRLLATLTLR
jgi:hypothetical protein